MAQISAPGLSPARIAKSYYTTVWDQHKTDRLGEFVAPDAVFRFAEDPPLDGLEAVARYANGFMEAVPDYRISLEDVFEAGDRAAVRWVCSGTHAKSYFGLKATKRKFRLSGITILQVADGKIIRSWAERDVSGVKQRLTAP